FSFLLSCILLLCSFGWLFVFFFFQAEDGIRDATVTGVQTCALPILQLPAEPCQPSPCLICLVPGARPGLRPGHTESHGHRPASRSEERRVGKEWRCRWSTDHKKKKQQKQSA